MLLKIKNAIKLYYFINHSLIMEEECSLKEYYRASNKVELVSMTSFVENENQSLSFASKKRTEEGDFMGKATSIKKNRRSNTIYIKSSEPLNPVAAPSLMSYQQKADSKRFSGESSAVKKEKGTDSKGSENPSAVLKKIESTAFKSQIEIGKDPKSAIMAHKAPFDIDLLKGKCKKIFTHTEFMDNRINVNKRLTTKPSLLLGGLSIKQKEVSLKEQLTASLSPSPFKEVDQTNQEAGLKQLAASSETTGLLLSPFYKTEISQESSSSWKKALKDYILHTLQTICIIKKLKEVPTNLLEKKSVKLEKKTGSKHSFLSL